MNSDKAIVAILILFTVGILTALGFGFLTADQENRTLFLIVLGVPIGISFLLLPRVALVATAIIIYFVTWFAETLQYLPRETIWLSDILTIVLVFRALTHRPFCKHPSTNIEKLILLVVLFAIGSGIYNDLTRETIIVGFRVGFRFIGLFLAIYHMEIGPKYLNRFMTFLFVIGLIQTPVAIWQYYQLGLTQFGDEMSGTFGNNQTPGVAIFLLVLFCYIVSKMIEEDRFRPVYLLMIGWMTVACILGEAKFYFLFLPILLAFLVRAELRKRPAMTIGLLVLGGALIISVDYLLLQTGGWMEGRNPLAYIGQLSEVYKQETNESSASDGDSRVPLRGSRWISSVRLAAASPKAFILGSGPGAITESPFSSSRSSAYIYYSKWGLNSITLPSLPWLLIEYGYVGTFLLLTILYMIYRRGKVLRTSDNIQMRVWGRTLEGMTILYIAWCLYTAAWQASSMSFIYWALAALLVKQSYALAPKTVEVKNQQEIPSITALQEAVAV